MARSRARPREIVECVPSIDIGALRRAGIFATPEKKALRAWTVDADIVDLATNVVAFFRNESCGKCVPCRLGAQKMVSLGENLLDGKINRAHWSNELLPLVADMGRAIELASICGLGRSVPVPLRTAINYFNDDVSKHLKQ